MWRFLRYLFSTITGLALWAALVVIGTLEGWWHENLAPDEDSRAFMDAAVEEIDANYNGNVAFVLIEDGEIFDEHFVSIGKPVDDDTLFQVASLGKWVAAWGVMALVDEGKLELDVPVSTYLTRWELPESDFNNDGVTVRRLLSHTAGLTDGLGYAGYAPGTDVKEIEDSLTHANASPGHDGRVRVGIEPGSKWQYSGGGYTLLQLLIEEVTGKTFSDYMHRAIFEPLGMSRSTYYVDLEETPNLATLYDVDGSEAIHYRFTSLAATSLYTSTSDLARLIEAHLPGPNEGPPGRGVLTPETLKQMREPHAWQMGAAIWGLGAMLYVPNNEGDFVIGHDGSNDPAINTAARLNPATGDGIIILETGNPSLATTLAGEWDYWQTGKADFLVFTDGMDRLIRIVFAGWAVIIFASLLIAWRRRRAGKAR